MGNIFFIVEILVILFLLWHINELRKSSRESEKVIKEMEITHREMHADTKIIKSAVDRLEKDIAKMKKS